MPVLVLAKDQKPTMTALALSERNIYQAPLPTSNVLKVHLYAGQTAYVLDTQNVHENGHDYVMAQLQPTPGSGTPEFIVASMDGENYVSLRPLTLDPTNIAQIMTMLVSALADLKAVIARLGK